MIESLVRTAVARHRGPAMTVIFPAGAHAATGAQSTGDEVDGKSAMREVIDVARVGRKLTPKAWPKATASPSV